MHLAEKNLNGLGVPAESVCKAALITMPRWCMQAAEGRQGVWALSPRPTEDSMPPEQAQGTPVSHPRPPSLFHSSADVSGSRPSLSSLSLPSTPSAQHTPHLEK